MRSNDVTGERQDVAWAKTAPVLLTVHMVAQPFHKFTAAEKCAMESKRGTSVRTMASRIILTLPETLATCPSNQGLKVGEFEPLSKLLASPLISKP